jgi:hypothetical protein
MGGILGRCFFLRFGGEGGMILRRRGGSPYGPASQAPLFKNVYTHQTRNCEILGSPSPMSIAHCTGQYPISYSLKKIMFLLCNVFYMSPNNTIINADCLITLWGMDKTELGFHIFDSTLGSQEQE